MVATQIFFMFTPNLGEDEPILDEHILQMGWFNYQPEMLWVDFFCCGEFVLVISDGSKD